MARNAAAFAGLRQTHNLSADDFVRTSAEPRHARGVKPLWRACAAAGGSIYAKDCSGLYCVGCERIAKLDERGGERGAWPVAMDSLAAAFRRS